MAITRKDLGKLLKGTTLHIVAIEDESGEETEVKVLHLADEVKAQSSLPISTGEYMNATSNKIYVAGADNIDAFMKDTDENPDGSFTYKGGMHLDVSKPKGRTVRGKFAITTPARVWLTKTKFSRLGGKAQEDRQENLNTVLSSIFGGGKVFAAGAATDVTTITDVKEPEIVPNQVNEDVEA